MTTEKYWIDEILEAAGKQSAIDAFAKIINELPIEKKITLRIIGVVSGEPEQCLIYADFGETHVPAAE